MSCRVNSSARPGAASYRGQKQKWFAARFLGADSEIAITPPAGHQVEFDAWRWCRSTSWSDLIVPFKRDVYGQVVEAFAAYAVPSTTFR